ncbi:PREDICTED: peptidyl-prolyl cis-trans isomerase FKBP9-like [Branchiostoma belcheri]|uniref:peptidylprolyl isomerase n=1 Tax=Branchiostoma belcheri TaxID=7741 RepID=A0A6P4ZEK7_BRABE|nr:PREDICTED: peptidyl-prolyl cis-trans isomerase FKBP9-like [Branchiostoma belcheri]
MVLMAAILAAVVQVLAGLSAEEVQVEVTFTPERCTFKSEEGFFLRYHYNGTFPDGKKFDSSHDRGNTFDFTLGKGEVIKGMDQALRGMCAGEKRKITIPPHLAYGDAGVEGVIPSGATLVFEVEMVEVRDPSEDVPNVLFWWVGETPTDAFGDMDANKDKIVTKDEFSTYCYEQVKTGSGNFLAGRREADLIEDMFHFQDQDADGVISFAEFSGPKQHDELYFPKMVSSVVILAVALQILAALAVDDTGEVEIEVTFKPKRCIFVSRDGFFLRYHYNGTFPDGEKFDSSHDRDNTFDFILGRGEVIKGMDQGLKGMCAGEKRKITIPPHLAYGDKGVEGAIPPGATLVFEVELIELLDPMDDVPKNLFWWVGETPQNSFGDSDTNRDKKISKEEFANYCHRMADSDKGIFLPGRREQDLIDDMFSFQDRDADGFISFDEFAGPKIHDKHDEL